MDVSCALTAVGQNAINWIEEHIMGKLLYIKGDLFTTNSHIIAHGCNIRGGYGSGVAGIMARLYPEARIAYFRKFQSVGWNLGDVQFVEIHPDRIIANMATQDTYGGPGVHVSYDEIFDCFVTLFDYAVSNSMDVAIPKIGSGLAGGDWGKIEKIISGLLNGYHNLKVTCYTLD